MRFAVATIRSLAHRSRFAAAAAAAASFGTVVGGVTMLESARTPLPLARVVSYNVLSSHLCGADHYTMCKPEDLDPPTRRKRVEALLMEHMDKQAVICLQEVSVQWVGELTPFFERAGYTSSPHPHPNPKPHPNPYLTRTLILTLTRCGVHVRHGQLRQRLQWLHGCRPRVAHRALQLRGDGHHQG